MNGGTVTTTGATTVLAATPTIVDIATRWDGTSSQFNGNLEEIAIWFTQRLPNATLQAITT
jgi:hypothetical protein